MCRLLFITWDGPQTSYLTGLFLPILDGLARSGYSPHILQFTWGADEKIADTKKICFSRGIPYRAVRVRRAFGSAGSFFTAVIGSRAIWRAVRDWKINILMPRSLMPAIAVICMGHIRDLQIVFDADGFAADERADFLGLSRNSITFRVLKWAERYMVKSADSVMVRTSKAVDLFCANLGVSPEKFFVVTNGRESHLYDGVRPFRPDNSLRLCYVGSIGAQYLPDLMLTLSHKLYASLSSITLDIFTGDVHDAKLALARADFLDTGWIKVSQLELSDVPSALKSCDLAFALRKQCFSSQGVAPIKIGEYLMAGLPIIGTAGIGDVEPLIQAGVMFPYSGDDDAVVRWVTEQFLPNKLHLANEATRLGTKLFGIEHSIKGYELAILYAIQPVKL